MSFNTSPPPRRKPLIVALAVIVIVLTVGAVYAIFSQTLPSVNIPGQFGLTPCPNPLVAEGTPTAGAGSILYDCGTGTHAFTVSNGPGQATPTWKPIPTSPTGITVTLSITTSGSCSAFSQLTNNTAFTFPVSASYDYCLGYSGVPLSGGTVGPVTIQWAP